VGLSSVELKCRVLHDFFDDSYLVLVLDSLKDGAVAGTLSPQDLVEYHRLHDLMGEGSKAYNAKYAVEGFRNCAVFQGGVLRIVRLRTFTH